MAGEIRGEGELSGETLEEQKYKEFIAADAEIRRLWPEIYRILTTTSDKVEAERLVLEGPGPKMDEATKRARQAYEEWQKAMVEDVERHERETGREPDIEGL